MQCETTRERLPAIEDHLDDLLAHHLDRCPWCRAEGTLYQRLRAELGSLVDRRHPVDEELLGEILAALDRCDARNAARSARAGRAAACIGGLAAAGALVMAGRRRAS